MTHKTSYALLLTSGLIFTPSVLAQEDSSVSLLVGNCIACHGPQGSSLGPATPTIAGMSQETFIDAMKAYQAGERPSTIMGRIAKGYTEKDFEAMAGYFTKSEFIRQAQQIDTKKAKKGQKLHDEFCEKCHVDGGFTDEDGSNILAGQWFPYLQFTLDDFQSGEREMTKKMKGRMEKMVKTHGEKSLEDIIHYYASQTKMEGSHKKKKASKEADDE